MNTREFIPNTEAFSLRKLGFDLPCLGYYNQQGEFRAIMLDKNTARLTVAPSYRDAFKFFRDKYKLEGWVVPYRPLGLYTYIIETSTVDDIIDDILAGYDDFEDFNTWEEAELGLIKSLIEIITTNITNNKNEKTTDNSSSTSYDDRDSSIA